MIQEAKCQFCGAEPLSGWCGHCGSTPKDVEVVPRSEAEAAELLALRLYDLMRDDDAEHMTEDDVEFVLRLRDAHPREETP